jgi:hypothetical protein
VVNRPRPAPGRLSSLTSARNDAAVTTYGLGDAAFAEVRDRWQARWQSLAKDPELTC